MIKKLSIWCAFLMFFSLQLPSSIDGRRSDRRSSITAAFQDPSIGSELLITQEPIKLASIDKISRTFDETNR
ncbi:MAG TPA: hypothetical protein VI521_00605, partial [Candidatus Babeliales bacterium]|nr:hypothetical protein [Candidatus Babeliales bacterium]